jgi:hypothetical protein
MVRRDWRTKAACTISHMRLWQHCIDINEPIMILEHDANFITYFRYKYIACSGTYKMPLANGEWTGGICGINSPIGTTRKARMFNTKVEENVKSLNTKYRFIDCSLRG